MTLTGPSGKIMLLPEETPDADVIMVGTGTGIAPYRGFLRRLFVEDTPAARYERSILLVPVLVLYIYYKVRQKKISEG